MIVATAAAMVKKSRPPPSGGKKSSDGSSGSHKGSMTSRKPPEKSASHGWDHVPKHTTGSKKSPASAKEHKPVPESFPTVFSQANAADTPLSEHASKPRRDG